MRVDYFTINYTINTRQEFSSTRDCILGAVLNIVSFFTILANKVKKC